MSNLLDNLKNNTLFQNENEAIENNYQKSFSKISRDFITRDELKWILMSIFNSINNVNPEIGNALFESFNSMENIEIAINKSREYDMNQQLPNNLKRKYEDLK